MSAYTTLTNLPSETYMEKKKRLENEKKERQEDIRKRLNRLTNAVKKHIETFDTPVDDENNIYVVLTIKKYKKRCLSFTKSKHMLYEQDGSGNEFCGQKRFVKIGRGMFNVNALAYDECNHFHKRPITASRLMMVTTREHFSTSRSSITDLQTKQRFSINLFNKHQY
jgi:hypothetical protein